MAHRKILVLGAGRSSPALIDYLIERSGAESWQVTVADESLEQARSRVGGRPGAKAISLDICNGDRLDAAVSRADVVISLMPPALHILVAHSCLRHGKHLLTASYVTPQLRRLNRDAMKAGILLLNECGLDPGIDHMSAMDGIERLTADPDTRLTGFKSFAGGLVAPESDDNPWGYKFTWNPGNVIRAGQGTARFVHRGKMHFLPYSRVFAQAERITIREVGTFDAYANRDSLLYRHLYGIEDVPTMIRGTLRHTGYCSAWNVFVRLGLTDDSFIVENSRGMTYAALVDAFLPPATRGGTVRERLARFFRLDPHGRIMNKIHWTGVLGHGRIPLQHATPAAILQDLLERKWIFRKGDRDMVVMVHLLEYETGRRRGGKANRGLVKSWMCIKGDARKTAMARTVGLPLGIAARLLLAGRLRTRGVRIPVMKELYRPALEELASLGIGFRESFIRSGERR